MEMEISTVNQTLTGKEFAWRAHPARERLGSAIAVSFVILGIILAIYYSFESITWSVISLIVLVLSLNRFFFPSQFKVDNNGITAKYFFSRQRYDWKDIRRYLSDRYGVYLSTRRQSSRFDSFRGMNILFGQNREEVLKQIQAKVRKAGSV